MPTGKAGKSTTAALSAAQMTQAIIHTARRIDRGDPGDLRGKLQDLVKQCLRANAQDVLEQAAEQVLLDDGDAWELIEDVISENSQALIGVDPLTGHRYRISLFAIPVSLSGAAAVDTVLPAALSDTRPVQEALVRAGIAAEHFTLSPALYDPGVLDARDACATYRLLCQLAPATFLNEGPVTAADDRPETAAEPLPAGHFLMVEKVILGAWVQRVGHLADPALDDLAVDVISHAIGQAIGPHCPLHANIQPPMPLEDALAFLENSRPARHLIASVLLALAEKGIRPQETFARLAGRLGGKDALEDLLAAQVTGPGTHEVQIALDDLPVRLVGVQVSLFEKSAGETAAPVHVEEIDIQPWMDDEEVLSGIATALDSIGVDQELEIEGRLET